MTTALNMDGVELARELSHAALSLSVGEAQALVEWTLDDIPILTRTIFNAAKCLDGVQIPQSIAHLYREPSPPSPASRALPGKYARWGVRKHAFDGRVGSEDLWQYGDGGRGYCPPRQPVARVRSSGEHSSGSLTQMKPSGGSPARPSAALSPGRQEGTDSPGDLSADGELPACLKALVTTHRRELHRLFMSWEVCALSSAGIRVGSFVLCMWRGLWNCTVSRSLRDRRKERPRTYYMPCEHVHNACAPEPRICVRSIHVRKACAHRMSASSARVRSILTCAQCSMPGRSTKLRPRLRHSLVCLSPSHAGAGYPSYACSRSCG